MFATLREMLDEMAGSRDLLWQMTLRDLKIRYKQAFIGFGWALLMPTLIVAAGFIIKHVMAQMTNTPLGPEAFASVMVKAVPWGFFLGALSFATTSLTSNLNLVTKIYFPREVLPLSCVVTQLIDTSVGAALVTVLLVTFKMGIASWQLLWIIPLAVLIVLYTIGACLLCSCANLFFRDVKYLVQVLLTFGVFFTPVFFDAENLGPVGSKIIMLNPLSPLFEGLQLVVTQAHPLSEPLYATSKAGASFLVWHPLYLIYAATFAVPGTLAAWWLFHKLEFVFAEYI